MSVKTADPVDQHVGQRIRIERMSRGISQEVLARKLGITFQQVQKYEKGVNRVSAGRLTRIAEIFGLQTAAAFLPTAQDSGANAANPVIKLALQVLTMHGGRDLLEAYAAIAEREDRNAIVRCAQAMAAKPAIELAEAS